MLSETDELRRIVAREVETFGRMLAGRERTLFERRIISEESTTLADISHQFGVSRERVRQIESRLKIRLRAHLRAVLGDAVPASHIPVFHGRPDRPEPNRVVAGR